MLKGKIFLNPREVVGWAAAALARKGTSVDTLGVRFSAAKSTPGSNRPQTIFHAILPLTTGGELTLNDFKYFKLLESEAKTRGYKIAPLRGRFVCDQSNPQQVGLISAELYINLPDHFPLAP